MHARTHELKWNRLDRKLPQKPLWHFRSTNVCISCVCNVHRRRKGKSRPNGVRETDEIQFRTLRDATCVPLFAIRNVSTKLNARRTFHYMLSILRLSFALSVASLKFRLLRGRAPNACIFALCIWCACVCVCVWMHRRRSDYKFVPFNCVKHYFIETLLYRNKWICNFGWLLDRAFSRQFVCEWMHFCETYEHEHTWPTEKRSYAFIIPVSMFFNVGQMR